MLMAALATFVAATLATVILLKSTRWLPVALPSARSLHVKPVSRVGGLAVIAGVLAGLPGWAWPPGIAPGAAWVVGLAIAAVAAVSLLDDWRGTRAGTRLGVQLLAAMAVAATLALPAGGLAFAGVVLTMMWMANLFNFMDGNDGLAAIAAICGFAAYAVAAQAGGGHALPFVCIAVACLPFLAVNLPPARMFMGDVGAVTLGFAAAAFGIAGVVAGAWPAWLPLLAFVTLILDATLTLARRAARGERVWQAHKLHYYQRLNQLGAGHRGTLALYATLAAATSATAAGCVVAAPRQGWVALGVWIVILVLLFATIDYHWKRRSTAQ
jgi:UDP-N-acetylmuramyl pentapeptide phosphotransferase/UDP-N-acetylglucosamine-1-phosphate transferase